MVVVTVPPARWAVLTGALAVGLGSALEHVFARRSAVHPVSRPGRARASASARPQSYGENVARAEKTSMPLEPFPVQSA